MRSRYLDNRYRIMAGMNITEDKNSKIDNFT